MMQEVASRSSGSRWWEHTARPPAELSSVYPGLLEAAPRTMGTRQPCFASLCITQRCLPGAARNPRMPQ
eukprot:2653570-Alexandrium_andersonii.AAC.1